MFRMRTRYYRSCNILSSGSSRSLEVLLAFPRIMSVLYNYIRTKKHLKNEQRNMDAAAKKIANTSGVGKSNNYYNHTYTF